MHVYVSQTDIETHTGGKKQDTSIGIDSMKSSDLYPEREVFRAQLHSVDVGHC